MDEVTSRFSHHSRMTLPRSRLVEPWFDSLLLAIAAFEAYASYLHMRDGFNYPTGMISWNEFWFTSHALAAAVIVVFAVLRIRRYFFSV